MIYYWVNIWYSFKPKSIYESINYYLIVSDFSNLLNGAIKEDDIITGKYVYDSLAKDNNDDPTVGDYQHNSKPYGLSLKAGKLVFQTDPKNVDFLLELVNW